MGYVDTAERDDRPAGWITSSEFSDPERARAEWLKFNPDRGEPSWGNGGSPPAARGTRTGGTTSQAGRAGQSGPASSTRGRQTPAGREPAPPLPARVVAALRASDRSILELDDQEFEALLQRFYERRRVAGA